jgi:hypothetical protein
VITVGARPRSENTKGREQHFGGSRVEVNDMVSHRAAASSGSLRNQVVAGLYLTSVRDHKEIRANQRRDRDQL